MSASSSAHGSPDLYALLGLSRAKAATLDARAIRRAYHVMALKLHPDKASKQTDDEREKQAAKSAFEKMKMAFDVLSDPVKKGHYDRTGVVPGELNDEGFWQAYERYRGVKISEKDIEEYEKQYKNSEEEKQDLVEFFNEFAGDITRILAVIVASEDSDRERFVKFYENELATLAKGKSGKTKSGLVVNKKSRENFQSTKTNIMSMAELDEDGEDVADGDEGEGDNEGEEDEDDMKGFIASEEEEEEDGNNHAQLEDGEEEGDNQKEFDVGDDILSQKNQGKKWYAGTILKRSKDQKKKGSALYDIKYKDDGSIEKNVKPEHIHGVEKNVKDDEIDDIAALQKAIRNKHSQRQAQFDAFTKKYSSASKKTKSS